MKLSHLITKTIKNKPILYFFFFTFIFSWGCWIPLIFIKKEITIIRMIGTFSPIIFAIIITKVIEGNYGIKQLLKPFLIWKFNIVWYIFCIFSTALICFTAIGVSVSFKITDFYFNDLSKIYILIPIFLYVLLTSVIGEETGWRGFAQKRLQIYVSPITASIIIGIIWGFWHLPLFFIPNNFHHFIPFWLFLIQEVALSIVIAWIYNNTKKSLLSVHIFHTASNITLGVLPILPMDTKGNLVPLYITVILLVLFSICLILSKSIKNLEIE